MDDPQTPQTIKPVSEIKKELEEEEIRGDAPCTTTNTAEEDRQSATTRSENNGVAEGPRRRGRPRKTKEPEEELEVTPSKRIKTEPEEEEERSEEDEEDGDDGEVDDPDYEPDDGATTSREKNGGFETPKRRGRPRKTKEPEEELEVTPAKKIKTEPEEEEEWSEEDEEDEPDYGSEDDDDGCYYDDPGADLCKQRNADVNGSTSTGGDGLSWEFRSAPDVKPAPRRFRPVRDPGPTMTRTSSWTPLSVFQLFCSSSVIRTVVENTNKNGARQRPATGKKKWRPVTFKEFYIFLNAVMYTSLVKLQSWKDYWKKAWLYDLKFPRNYMSRDRFREIKSALILCDPEEDEKNESKKDTPEYDKLFKVQPFYDEILSALKAHFHPHRNICVHERMVKNKPLKCGYRLFALADSSTGYTWNLYLHTGKSAATRGQTPGYTAVKNLLPLATIGSGYTLYTDFPFTSPSLFTELYDKHIDCCGILSKHHSEFPKRAKNDFPAPQAARGDIRWLRKDKLLFVKWMDTREVAMCSTVHEAFTGQVMKRPVKQGKGWVPKQFSCPDAVADFNRHMILSKRSDFDFSYNMPCTRVEWHRIFFYHLLDIVVVNSFILYNEMLKNKGDNLLTQKDFREELCKEMLKFAHGSEPTSDDANTGPSVPCMPLYFVNGDPNRGRKKCRWCNKQTPIYCQKCLVPLCLLANRNCYKEWHEAKWIK